jgi:hypothetical protein
VSWGRELAEYTLQLLVAAIQHPCIQQGVGDWAVQHLGGASLNLFGITSSGFNNQNSLNATLGSRL